MVAARPLDSFPLLQTSSLEEIRASLARVYAKPEIKLIGRGGALRTVMNFRQLEHVAVSYGSYGADVQMRFSHTNVFSQVFVLAGKSEVSIGGKSFVFSPAVGGTLPADATFTMTHSAAYDRLTLAIDFASLTAMLATLTGQPVSAPVEMHPVGDNGQQPARLLRQNFLFFVRQLSADAPLPPIVLAEFEQALMAMFLHANRHNYSHLLEQAPADVAPWQVRWAEEYIEANWNKPLDLEALAAQSGVGVLGLFHSFRRSRGYSPADFLKRVRLRHAHEMLRHPQTGATVAQVASACGYADADHFSEDYLAAFGEWPSQTLRRAGGAAPTRH